MTLTDTRPDTAPKTTPQLSESRALTPAEAIKTGLQQMRPQLAMALPPHISAEKFERVVLTALNMTPELLEADRRSLFNACQKAAQDGLLPDGRDAALVIFKDKSGKKLAQYMPMVGGIIRKARQSGEIAEIRARVVYERDAWSYVMGDDERIEHAPCLDGDRGKPRLVYAIAKFKDGSVEREVMTVADVERVRKVSRAGQSQFGPWVQWWDEMAKKTVIRRLSKRLPLSSDLMQALGRDDEPTEFERMKAGAKDALLGRAAAQFSAPQIEAPAEDADAAAESADEAAAADVVDAEIVTEPAEPFDMPGYIDHCRTIFADERTAEGVDETLRDMRVYATVRGATPADLGEINAAAHARKQQIGKATA